MIIWDGNLHDKTDFESNSFLKINSCGIESPNQDYTVIRKKGRKDRLLLLICDGICEAERNGKAFGLSPGSVMIFAPNEPQLYRYYGKCTSMWVHFSGTAAEEILESCGLYPGHNAISQNRNAVEAFLELIKRFHTPGRESFANAALLELLYTISEAAKTPSESKTDSRLLSVISYINTNYQKYVSVDNLARISGYSKSRFSHLFVEITGTTPIKYLNNIRLKAGADMLLTTSLDVSDIAYRCGFSDALYFSRSFRKKYGISPTEFRKNKV